MKITAQDLKQLEVIDEIIPEVKGELIIILRNRQI